MNSDEARWTDARNLIEPPPAADVDARQRRYVRISWIAVGAALAAAVATRVLAGETVAAARVVFLSGIGLGVVGLAVRARSGRFGSAFSSPLSALDPQQRRQLLSEVQGRRSADLRHLDVARAFAYRQSRPSIGMPFLWGGLVLLGIAGLFGHPSGLRIAGVTAALAFFLGVLASGVVQARRARRFLAEHPAPDPDVSRDER